MKITVFNPDGSVKNVRDVNLHVPEYISNFDNRHSFLNITAQEIEVLESKGDFVRKTITKELLIQSVCYDYSNFVRNIKIEVCKKEIIAIYEQSLSDPNIVIGNNIFSSILRIYSMDYFWYGVIPEEDISVLYEYEEFLYYLYGLGGGVEYYYSAWIRILFYHAAKSSGGWRYRYIDINEMEKEHFYSSLQNLINKYYYTLARIERLGYNLPIGLKTHKDILKAFVTKSKLEKSTIYYSKSQFVTNLICALYKTGEQNRGDIYSLAYYILNSHPFLNRGNNLLGYNIQRVSKPQIKTYTIELGNHHNVIECKCELSESELFSMRDSKGENDLYTELRSTIERIYEGYVNVDVIKKRWETNVLTDAGTYFDSHPNRRDDWVGYYNFEVGRIREESKIIQNQMKPQRCFFHLLCDFIHPSENLSFSKDVLASLIIMLDEIKCSSQEGLYECMFKMNYIKGKLPQRDPKDLSVSYAMEYIECLFLPRCQHVVMPYQNYIQPLMRKLLSNSKVREKITKILPHGFCYGFNLKLVYNLLGLLHQSNIIKGGVAQLDKYIYDYNHNKGIEKYNYIERKSYLSNWGKEKSEIYSFKDELIKIVEQIIKDS